MPELRSRRESSTIPADLIPIEGDHLFQTIPTTDSDESEKVAAFRPEWVVAFRRKQWPPSRRNRWPLSPGKRSPGEDADDDVVELRTGTEQEPAVDGPAGPGRLPSRDFWEGKSMALRCRSLLGKPCLHRWAGALPGDPWSRC